MHKKAIANCLTRGIVLSLIVMGLTGCAAFEAERTRRGGYTDAVLDARLVMAESKELRILRATAILATLTHIAGSNVGGEERVGSVARQINSTARNLGSALAVAQSRCKLITSGTCKPEQKYYDPTFDLHMKRVTDDLFRIAAISLPRSELKRLVDNVEDGNWLSGLLSLWRLADDILDAGRWGMAGYRDLIDANGAIIGDGKIQSYKSGDGNFKIYSEAIDKYYGQGNLPRTLALDDLAPWFASMVNVCVYSKWYAVVDRPKDSEQYCSGPVVSFREGYSEYFKSFGVWEKAS